MVASLFKKMNFKRLVNCDKMFNTESTVKNNITHTMVNILETESNLNDEVTSTGFTKIRIESTKSELKQKHQNSDWELLYKKEKTQKRKTNRK